MANTRRPIWLDCDPGHDDAVAILMAIHSGNIQLLGVSTTHGNTSSVNTHQNAVRLLYAFDAPLDVHAHRGAIKPLIRKARFDPEIHGEDGLGGVEGLPTLDEGLQTLDPELQKRWNLDAKRSATDGMARAIKNSYINGAKVSIVTTGPMTNLALFLTMHPELYDAVEEIVFMGGGVGIGNRSAVAEFNILCDPEAAQLVLDCPIKKTMIPLNVTHTCIFTPDIHRRLLSGPNQFVSVSPSDGNDSPTTTLSTFQAATPLRHMLSTLILFFSNSYRSVFGFKNGPPIHDALTIAYLSRPDIFKATRYRVDVELAGTHTVGETVVDIWNYRDIDEDGWGADGKNCIVAEGVNVSAFFEMVLACVDKCDKMSPLNRL